MSVSLNVNNCVSILDDPANAVRERLKTMAMMAVDVLDNPQISAKDRIATACKILELVAPGAGASSTSHTTVQRSNIRR